MSGGSPVSGGLMRQRHSPRYASSGDDLEDDACSTHVAAAATILSPAQKQRTWLEVFENLLWIASVGFIIYYGDRHSNFMYLLWHDNRIRRLPLHLGLVSVMVNIILFLYTSVLAWSLKAGEKVELLNPSALPLVTLLGVISFCLFAFALWPIWSFLTIPLLVGALIALFHIIHGARGHRPQYDDGIFQTPRYASYRLVSKTGRDGGIRQPSPYNSPLN